MSETEEKDVAPEDVWFAERAGRVQSEYARIEAEKAFLSSEHSQLESRYNALDAEEQREKDDWGDIRTNRLDDIKEEKRALIERANRITANWNNLSAQEQAVQAQAHLTDYDTLLQASSEPSQMLLRAAQSASSSLNTIARSRRELAPTQQTTSGIWKTPWNSRHKSARRNSGARKAKRESGRVRSRD